ncbi:MAG: hypothetical protein ABIH99_05600 [Candidatus Micrarchaeota archaeon]
MLEEELTNKNLAIILGILQVLTLVLVVLTGNWLLIILSIFVALLVVAFWRFGYILKPLLTQRLNIIERSDKYEIPPAQDVVIKKVGNKYYASAFLIVKFNESVTEKSPEQLALTRESFERVVSTVNYVFKISAMVSGIDLAKYLDKIKARRSYAETKLSELTSAGSSANQLAEMKKYEREIESCNARLEHIASGQKPLECINYAMTTASSISKEEAVIRAKTQGNEIKALLSSALNVFVINATGDEMKRCFEWELSLPDGAEIRDQAY